MSKTHAIIHIRFLRIVWLECRNIFYGMRNLNAGLFPTPMLDLQRIENYYLLLVSLDMGIVKTCVKSVPLNPV